MATVTLFLCCLLGSVSLVYGQTLGELICNATSFNITVRNLVLLSSLYKFKKRDLVNTLELVMYTQHLC